MKGLTKRLAEQQLILLMLVGVVLFLTGCSSTPKIKEVTITTTATEKLQLNIHAPKPVVLQDVEWIIVTEENIAEVWESLRKDNEGVALFALRHKDYGTLALNLAEIRAKLGEYVIILKKYKEYYEEKK